MRGTEFLKRVLDETRKGSEVSLYFLREICLEAAESGEKYHLLAIGDCLYHLGIEEDRTNAERN